MRRARAAAMAALALLAGVEAPAAAAPAPGRVHHDLSVRLDPDARRLAATDRIALGCPCPGAFTLLPQLAIERLEVDGQPVRAAADAAGRVRLPLDGRPAHEVVVAYAGALDPTPADRVPDGPTIGADGTFLPGVPWIPTIAGARFTYALRVDVPASQRAVAAGRLLHEEERDGRWRAGWASDGPGDELALFAGPWRVTERMHGGTRLRTWLHPEVADVAAPYLDKLAFYLDLYAGWIGPYPYSAFSVASAPFPAGLGFPAATLLGTRVLRLPFIRDTSLGHEVLHAWWGNAVGVDVGQGNWAEGLTTFMADYTFVEWQGADAAREQRLRWLRELAFLPAARDRPLADFRGKAHTAEQVVGYHKAAMLLVMLRDRIGADAFAGGVRRFAAAQRFRAAAWSDLRAAFEDAAGVRLDAFFAQWLGRAGAPALALRDVAVAGGSVAFTVAQEPPAWRLDVPVVVETAAHRTVRHRVALAAASERITLPLPPGARALELDPDATVLRRLAPDEVPPILRHVAFDADASVVLAADAEAGDAAREVAARLLEGPPRTAPARASLPPGPLLVVGTDAAVSALLASAGLPAAPDDVRGRGTGRAWAARRPGGAPLAVVAARDAAALRALAAPLPHLAAQSWLVFDGPRATARGVWAPAARPLRAELPAPGAPPCS